MHADAHYRRRRSQIHEIRREHYRLKTCKRRCSSCIAHPEESQAQHNRAKPMVCYVEEV